MSPSVEVLFRLLRIALGNEKDFSLPLSVNWKEVIDISFEQGVAAIAVDGLQRIYDEIPNQVRDDALETLDSPELEDLKYEWFGEVMNAEQDFANQWSAAYNMGRLFRENGIRTFVMKGFAVGQYYPVPQHRQCGDLDCYLLGDYEKANRLMESAGIPVEYELYKHSKYNYQGLTVENHQFCIPVRGSKKNKALEKYLESCVERSTAAYIGDSCLETPSVMFNALFLTAHALNHFLSDGISLRHVCDWGMFLKACSSEVDWEEFKAVASRYGLLRFAESMSRLAFVVCGVEVSWIGDYALQPQDERLLNDIFNHVDNEHMNGSLWNQRRILVQNKLKSGWKYRTFTCSSVCGELLRNAYGLVFDRKPKL